MQYETKLALIRLNGATIERICKLTGEVLTIPNSGHIKTQTALNNTPSLFELNSDQLGQLLTIARLSDKHERKNRVDKLVSSPDFRQFARKLPNGQYQLAYWIYIFCGIPHSTLSITNCKNEVLYHTKSHISAYKSKFVTHDKPYYESLVSKARQEELLSKLELIDQAPLDNLPIIKADKPIIDSVVITKTKKPAKVITAKTGVK
jgi:hypothetical protein